ncbi:5' nucleotidase, NT5C type [Solibacillus sp. FSL H8-0538]|uniref:5' nucleotidase, NT5C type n=1 Tax=Solibacillus sp. FSL H8-0538 TaxID=2921400 RepID=UPI0030F4BBFE
MKFGFDIDDTLINLREHAFHLYNNKLAKELGLDVFRAIPTVEIHEPFGLTKEQGSNMWVNSMEEIYFTDCPAFEGALEVLLALERDGHDIYYITSRPKHYCTNTREWMKAQGFPVKDENFFCGMQDDEKIATIKTLELDYYFDDKPAVLETLRNVPTKVFVIDQSYNQNVAMPRMKNWAEFSKLVFSIK